MTKAARLDIDFEPIESDFLEKIADAVAEELHGRPDYYQLIQAVRAQGHRLEHRVIRGEASDDMVMLHLQLRDGGPTVGE